MRVVGIVLVILGAVVLGCQGFSDASVAGGIALVSGLLMLAAGGRQESQ
jgi:hypothetical protein